MRFARFMAAAAACLMVSTALLVALPFGVHAATWSPNQMVNEASSGQQISPSTAVGPNGVLHFAWTDYRNGASDPDIYYSCSGDNGTTFLHPNIEVSSDAQYNFTQGSPAIAVDSDENIIVAWSEFQGQDTNIMAARKTPFADAFEPLGLVNKVLPGPQSNPSISSDGGRTAIAWKDEGSRNEVKLWNSLTGAPLLDLKGHSGSVTSVDFSIDGSKLASASEDGLVKIWNAATGALVANLSGHTDVVTCVAWSPDGSMLATSSWDFTIRVWSASTYAETRKFTAGHNPINSIDWSPNGTFLVAGHNGEGDYSSTQPGDPNSFFNVTVWNVTSGAAKVLGQHGYSVNSVGFSDDGWHVASGSGASSSSGFDNSVRIWNASTGAEVRTISVAGGYVNSVSWSSGGNLAVAVENGSVELYYDPVANDTVMGSLSGHLGAVKSVDWLAGTSRLVSGGADARAFAWNASAMASAAATARLANTIHGVAISPDGAKIATGSGNSKIYRRSECHIYCAVSEDGGRTWPEQTRVDSVGSFYIGGASSPSVDVGPNGDIGVAWHEGRGGTGINIYYSNSTDGGATFAQDVRVSGGVGIKAEPSIALDQSGVAHIAWHDSRDKTTTERYDIYYGRSDAPGANVRVNATNASTQQQSASLAISEDGQVITVAWSQSFTQTGGGTTTNFYWIKCAQSIDAGATWATPDAVAYQLNHQLYVPALTMVNSHVNIAWEDYRRGDCNIFFSSTTILDAWPPSVVGVSPASGATNVSAYSPIVVRFSEPIDQVTFSGAFKIKSGASTWTADDLVMTWSEYGDKVSMKPLGWHLSYSTTYTATVAASVEDMSANAMTAPFSWSFSTGVDVDGPMIELLDAPEEVEYNSDAQVVVSVVDYTGISAVLLYYKMNGTANFHALPMMANSALNYEATIPAQGILGTILFYAWANDTFGNEGSLPANLSAGQYIKIEIVDRTAPVLTHVPIGAMDFDADATVNVSVSDDIGVSKVHLEYNTVQSDVIHVDNMTQVSAGNYTSAIPVPGDIGSFSYRIVALDASNNTGTTVYFNVLSEDRFNPVLGTPVAVQQADGTIVVTVSASDNHEVESVTMHFIPVGGRRYIEKEMSPGAAAGTYTATILEQEETGTFKYYVNATDPSGNVASSLDQNEGKPYSMWVEGKLPPFSWIVMGSTAVIAGAFVALALIIRKRRREARLKSKIVGQPEHPLESVNVPARAPEGGRPGKEPPAGKGGESAPPSPPKSG